MRVNWILILIATAFVGRSQAPNQLTSGEIYESLEQLNFLGNALYVAAHPDDENTRLISHLVNEVNAHTTYLSLTRGDGGQNLIGPEISELLGVIRTQELLAARRTDGGHQMFTRANDFGYSKSPTEAISIWDDEQVKHDVVWAIRSLKPDVIINRFDHSGNRRTHGHHTASAMLSHQLFEAAADPTAYPEQLQYVETWQPRRLFFNTSWWFYGSREKFNEADKSDMLSADIGTYYPLLGKSNNEIAAESRSNHKCQGFGSTGRRGSQQEYIKLLKGDLPVDKTNIFDGINTTWTRVKGGEQVQSIMDKVMQDYDFRSPAASVPQLVKAYKAIQLIEDPFWRDRKSAEIKEIIASCLGLYVEAIASSSSAVRGEDVTVDVEVTKRNKGDVILTGLSLQPAGSDTTMNIVINDNQPYYQSRAYTIPMGVDYTAPYWLEEEGSLGMYKVDELKLIGQPETPRQIKLSFSFLINGEPMTFIKDVVYKYNDPEDGEIFEPFDITPELFVSLEDKVYVFGDENPRSISVKVTAGATDQVGQVKIPLPANWTSTPATYDFSIKDKGASQTFEFLITPPSGASDIIINPVVLANEKEYQKSMIKIDYDHIPLQRVLMPAKARLTKIDLQKAGNRIAYIMGAGDAIPEAIRQIGYRVDLLTPEEISTSKLESYDALILGVRAYNTLDDIRFVQDLMHDYVENGGTMIVQYNTSFRLKVDEVGPYPISLSRSRVTVEEAEVRIIAPDHPAMNNPNKITSADFDGWVQERGLYFPNEWSAEYTPILSSNDPGEDPLEGGLLIAKHGQGHFVYTGYSWFRELPAGVPGAYRIFANLISLGNAVRP